MIAYKAFNKDLSCTSGGNHFQYHLGIWNEEEKANCARNGFHCAENPLDCLYYYSNWDNAVYYLVLADGDINEDAHDSRVACTRMKLVKQLNLEEFVAHSLKYISDHPFLTNHSFVCEESGKAGRGFVIVRGKNPVALGKQGDILGLVKERTESRAILEIGLYQVDGKTVMPNTWYNIMGSVKEEVA